MITSSRRRRRTVPLALALVGVGVVVLATACADRPEVAAAASTSGSAAVSSEPAPTGAEQPSTSDELAAALLPAEAFGPGANFVTVDVRQLTTTASSGIPEGGSVTPPECGQDLGAGTLTPEDFGAIVAQSATTQDVLTVQVLAESEQVDAGAPPLGDQLERCSRVTVDAPDGSTATIELTALEVPDLGDTSEGVRATVALQGPDGTNLTVPLLMAAATDGPRLVFLQQVANGPAPLDEAAFTDLFEQAFHTQQDA